jgi:1-pyrroline-5-carboxylate dehydrogenase
VNVVEFTNEPLTDFSRPEAREAAQAALERAEADRGRSFPLIIGGERVETGSWIESWNPSEHSSLVGKVAKAGTAEAERALAAAEQASASWAALPAAERAAVGLRAAALMRKRRHDLSATMVLEVGKTWPEADADTAEAIDFLDFYARLALELDQPPPLVPAPGTYNELRYLPLGVGVVIPPWNFPLAIACGMVSAAILAGNTVVFKPASVSPVIAARLVELLEEAGLPPGVVNFVPGPGGEVGDHLVGHPRTRFVSFTGSREVGVHIYELAARVQPGQIWLKRVVAEMGGKDAIVVDASADVEAAVAGIVSSAFGFQGQKCSACSRVIVDRSLYQRVVDEVGRRAEALRVGPAVSFDSDLGPVVDRSQFEKVSEYLQRGRSEGRLVAGGEADDAQGYYVRPTVFADLSPEASLMQEEIFGPVLAMTSAPDFETALQIANGTPYGLTGGVYARDRARLQRAREAFHVGNLYFNRKITGALVGVEPFGGFNMSGTNSKAGGFEYLKLFTEAKVISERL